MTDCKNDKKLKVEKAKKIYKIVSNVIVAIVAIFLCAIFVMVIVQKSSKQQPKIFGHYFYTVLTPSMEPELEVGTIILAKEVSSIDEITIGKIVTYPSSSLGGRNLTHRVVDVETDKDGVVWVTTKGDANFSEDPKIKATDISSIMVKNLPTLGKFMKFLVTPTGYIVVIALPLLIVLILIILQYIKDKGKDDKKILKIELENKMLAEKLKNLTDEEKTKLLSNLSEQNVDESADKKECEEKTKDLENDDLFDRNDKDFDDIEQ